MRVKSFIFPRPSSFIPGKALATYRYFRWSVTKTTNGSLMGAGEIEITTAGGDVPAAAMTTNTAPSPLVATASSEFSGSFQAWQAFDNATTDWVAANSANGSGVISESIKIDLGAGNAVAPTGFKYTSSTNSGRAGPIDFIFEGSNDDSSYTTLKTITGASWSYPETKTYTLP